jgi:hypoxanthine phosphoribosyltransferase
MKISSYKKNKSTGKITKHKDCNDLTGKRVIVVVDIVDTGTSFKMIVDYLKNEKHAESVEFCSLLDKPEGRKPRNKNISLDYTGFIVPKLFVYGYGLDINGEHRELKGVYYKE